MRGLCGTLTWTQHDDFTTPDGDVENTVASFAKKFTTENCVLPEGTPADACTTFTQKRDYAEAACSIIHTAVFQVSAYLMEWVLFSALLQLSPHVHTCPFALCYRRHVMMRWRESTISICACWRFVDALQRGCVTVPSSLLTPNTALRRVSLYAGVIKHSVVSRGLVTSYFGKNLAYRNNAFVSI